MVFDGVSFSDLMRLLDFELLVGQTSDDVSWTSIGQMTKRLINNENSC